MAVPAVPLPPALYCESGFNTGPMAGVLYPNDPLWDGQDCNGLERIAFC